jgi:hypothetical protein
MMKRTLIFLLCCAIPALSSLTEGRSQEQLPGLNENARRSLLKRNASKNIKPQVARVVIRLPQTKGAWLIEISRDGGMRPSKSTVSINFAGDIGVTSEHSTRGQTVIDCSLKEKVRAKDLQALKEAIASARLSTWSDRYEDPAHPICCDQPTTNLMLKWRAADGTTKTYSTSWYPGSAKLRPADLVRVEELVEPLWNKVGEDCERND